MDYKKLDLKLIGLTVKQASKIADIRVMREDGKAFMGTCDWKPSRINVAVVKGKITEILDRG